MSRAFVILFGLWVLVALPLVALLTWARVRTGDHTVLQVAVGACVGAIVGGLSFALIMRLL